MTLACEANPLLCYFATISLLCSTLSIWLPACSSPHSPVEKGLFFHTEDAFVLPLCLTTPLLAVTPVIGCLACVRAPQAQQIT